MSDDGDIVLDIWIAIEKLATPPPDKNASQQKNDHCDCERDAQRRDAGLFNYRYRDRTIRFHAKNYRRSRFDCSYSSEGFFAATEGRIASPSSEVNAASSR